MGRIRPVQGQIGPVVLTQFRARIGNNRARIGSVQDQLVQGHLGPVQSQYRAKQGSLEPNRASCIGSVQGHYRAVYGRIQGQKRTKQDQFTASKGPNREVQGHLTPVQGQIGSVVQGKFRSNQCHYRAVQGHKRAQYGQFRARQRQTGKFNASKGLLLQGQFRVRIGSFSLVQGHLGPAQCHLEPNMACSWATAQKK